MHFTVCSQDISSCILDKAVRLRFIKNASICRIENSHANIVMSVKLKNILKLSCRALFDSFQFFSRMWIMSSRHLSIKRANRQLLQALQFYLAGVDKLRKLAHTRKMCRHDNL